MPNQTADTNDITDGGSAGDFNLQAWTFPIAATAATGTILTTAGSVYGSALYVRRATTVSTLFANITVAGGTLTASNCWAMLYNSAGTLLGQSADQSTLWATAGLQAMTLTPASAGSLAIPAGLYWGSVVATGTTLPTFSRSAMGSASAALASAFYNLGVGNSLSRAGVLATSITTTPGAIVPGSISQTAALPLWFGLN